MRQVPNTPTQLRHVVLLQRYAIDQRKIERELDWTPAHTFEQGLRETVQWYLANEWWWGPLRAQDATVRRGLERT